MKSRILRVQESGFVFSADWKEAGRKKLHNLLPAWNDEQFENLAKRMDGLCWALLIVSAMFLLPVCFGVLSR